MRWTIRYKTSAGREAECKHDFGNEEAAIKYAHSMQFHLNSAIIIELSNATGRKITGKELEALLSTVAK
jgi:hypothetical protein